LTLVDSDDAAARACAELLAGDAIGFDTESRPTFRKGELATGPHLVQLASDDRAWLFPVARGVDRSSLQRILESTAVLKVGFGLGNDRSALRERLGIELANFLDLGEVLRGPGHRGTVGTKVAVAHFLGRKLQKSKKTAPATGPARNSANASCSTPPTTRTWRCGCIGRGRKGMRGSGGFPPGDPDGRRFPVQAAARAVSIRVDASLS
jgi:ribonuclease D